MTSQLFLIAENYKYRRLGISASFVCPRQTTLQTLSRQDAVALEDGAPRLGSVAFVDEHKLATSVIMEAPELASFFGCPPYKIYVVSECGTGNQIDRISDRNRADSSRFSWPPWLLLGAAPLRGPLESARPKCPQNLSGPSG